MRLWLQSLDYNIVRRDTEENRKKEKLSARKSS